MSKLFISKRGEINTESNWRLWLEDFWTDIGKADDRKSFQKPYDSWDRLVRVLGLQEVQNENFNGDDFSNGGV